MILSVVVSRVRPGSVMLHVTLRLKTGYKQSTKLKAHRPDLHSYPAKVAIQKYYLGTGSISVGGCSGKSIEQRP